jgi:hypothetical protein
VHIAKIESYASNKTLFNDSKDFLEALSFVSGERRVKAKQITFHRKV